jgi:hypothetical protein
MKTRVLSVYVALIVSTPVAVFAQQRQAIDNVPLSAFVLCDQTKFQCDDTSNPIGEARISQSISRIEARRTIYKVSSKGNTQQYVFISEFYSTVSRPSDRSVGIVKHSVLVTPDNSGQAWQYVKP